MTSINDPYASREAKRYENPIPSREYILQKLQGRIGPATVKQLQCELGLLEDASITALRRRLQAMERDGQLISDRKGAYGLIDRTNLIAGRIQGHRDGYGFLCPDDNSGDVFLSHRQMRTVLDGDKGLVRLCNHNRKGRQEGIIVAVTERNTQQIVGRLYNESGIAFVRPDNQRISHHIQLLHEPSLPSSDGQYVVVELIQQPDKHNQAIGKIVEVLGEHMAPGIEVDVAIRTHNIPHQWPTDVLQKSDSLPLQVVASDQTNRFDLRSLPFVTIDGEDARDFDDAIYAYKKRSGDWCLYVAIADVSHYVHPATTLDQEAHRRGTSVYFPGRTLPMLPYALSHGLCSLKPQVDRLVMICEMTISKSGQLCDYQFYEGIIHSHARLTYNQVVAMLDLRSEYFQPLRQQHANVIANIDELYRLYGALRQARIKRGTIDFTIAETQIVFSKDRKIDQIVALPRNDAHRLVEECMLCANVSAARFLHKLDLPALYRVHMRPTLAKLESLRSFLKDMELTLAGGNEPKPMDYQNLLSMVQNRHDAHLLQTVVLRSLSQAFYTPANEGHFGLCYQAYAHFTSPIRRYPDLLVHRAIRSVIQSNCKTHLVARLSTQISPTPMTYPYNMDSMKQLGEHCSMAERRADEASWDVTGWLKCEYMQAHVGCLFMGTVNAVTSFGLFVELNDVHIEGLLHISNLPSDYYHFNPTRHCIEGDRNGRSFRLGDLVQIRVIRVDLDNKKIDFALADSSTDKNDSGSHATDQY